MGRTELGDAVEFGGHPTLRWQPEGRSLSWEDEEDGEKAAEEWLWHSSAVFGDWESPADSSHSWGAAPGPGSDLGTWQMLVNTRIPGLSSCFSACAKPELMDAGGH